MWCCHQDIVIARVHPVHLMNADWAPGGRQPSDQTSCGSASAGCVHPAMNRHQSDSEVLRSAGQQYGTVCLLFRVTITSYRKRSGSDRKHLFDSDEYHRALLGRFCDPRSVYTNVTTCWPNGVQNRSFVVKRNKQHVGLTRQLYSNAKTLLLYALSQLVKPLTQSCIITTVYVCNTVTLLHCQP